MQKALGTCHVHFEFFNLGWLFCSWFAGSDSIETLVPFVTGDNPAFVVGGDAHP